jgi:hypothetical protein
MSRPLTPKEMAEEKERDKDLNPLQDLIMDEHLARNEYPAVRRLWEQNVLCDRLFLQAKLAFEKEKFASGGHCSLMARFMTEDMFNKYKNTLRSVCLFVGVSM